MQGASFTARFRKRDFAIRLSTTDPSTGQIAKAIAAATGADEETIKLLVPGRKGQMLHLLAKPSQPGLAAGVSLWLACLSYSTGCSCAVRAFRRSSFHIGLKPGVRFEVYASTKQEIEQVRNSKDLPGLASFEQELKQTMRRQRGSRAGTLKLPSGQCSWVSPSGTAS